MGWFRSSRSSTGDRVRSDRTDERAPTIEPGVPGRCPACEGLGYIDDLDLARRYQIQHCKSCGHRWEYLFDDEGGLLGLTELDGPGAPTRGATAVLDLGGDDEVIDLREPARPPAPEEMTPAEWLRHSLRR